MCPDAEVDFKIHKLDLIFTKLILYVMYFRFNISVKIQPFDISIGIAMFNIVEVLKM